MAPGEWCQAIISLPIAAAARVRGFRAGVGRCGSDGSYGDSEPEYSAADLLP
jgi:hypothetical protein